MKSRLSILFSAAILMLLPLDLSGQEKDPATGNINSKFQEFCSRNPFEDLFIHCDRDTYTAGENIFLKAYLFDRDSLLLSATSSCVYVELISPLNVPVEQIKINLENGIGSSLLSIPDTLMNGRYKLRAYTSRMKNFMPYGCFMKSLCIANPFSNHYINFNYTHTGKNQIPYRVRFYPEGGRLIAELPARVGIHAFDRFGCPTGFRGVLVNGLGKIITSIIVDSTGLGLVEFVPEKEMSYIAVNDSDKSRFSLPEVNDYGISLRVIESATDSLRFLVMTNNVIESGNTASRILIRSLGKLLFSKELSLTHNQTMMTLPMKKLEEGINDIVIFDGSGKLAAERYIFKTGNLSAMNSPSREEQYGKREKINIEIGPEELNTRSMPDEMSVSVSVSYPGNIILSMKEWLVLGSEYMVEDITRDLAELFYISSSDKKEIIMLGLSDNWIDWKKIIEGTYPPAEFPTETNGQHVIVSGTQIAVKEDVMQKPAFMSSPGKVPEFQYSLPDRQNRYIFFIDKGEEEKDFVIQMPDTITKAGYKIENPFSDRFISTDFQTDTTRGVVAEEIQMISRNYQVMKIYNIPGIGSAQNNRPEARERTSFYGKPDHEVILKNYISLPAMQEVFFELIPEVNIRKNNNTSKFQIIDPETNTILYGEPELFIDGVHINDPTQILNLNPDGVEKIDIITSEYLVGDLIFSGIINVITKNGDLSEIPLPVNSFRIRYRLFDPPADYIMPDYSDTTGTNKKFPDFRNTLCWKDNLKSPVGGKTSIEFWTSDFASKYIISIAGIDSSGRPVSCLRRIFIR